MVKVPKEEMSEGEGSQVDQISPGSSKTQDCRDCSSDTPDISDELKENSVSEHKLGDSDKLGTNLNGKLNDGNAAIIYMCDCDAMPKIAHSGRQSATIGSSPPNLKTTSSSILPSKCSTTPSQKQFCHLAQPTDSHVVLLHINPGESVSFQQGSSSHWVHVPQEPPTIEELYNIETVGNWDNNVNGLWCPTYTSTSEALPEIENSETLQKSDKKVFDESGSMLPAMVAGYSSQDSGDNAYIGEGFAEYYPEYGFGLTGPEVNSVCPVQNEYGPATVRMVSTNSNPPLAIPLHVPHGHYVQQIVDHSGVLRHIILSAENPYTAMGIPYPPGDASQPGHYYQYHPGPYVHHYNLQTSDFTPGPMNHSTSCGSHRCQGQSPPPAFAYKDERTQKQHSKMKRKLEERKRISDTASISSTHSTPPLSPKKDGIYQKGYKDQRASASGLEEDGGLGASTTSEDEEERVLTELLSSIKPPKVSEVTARSALLQWEPLNGISGNEEVSPKSSDYKLSEDSFQYEVLLNENGRDGKYKVIYKGSSLEFSLTDLKPCTEYGIMLVAIHDELKGYHSESVCFKTLSCEPEAPQPPKLLSRTKSSLQLKWSAACDNGSKIISYKLESDQGVGGPYTVVYEGSGKQCKLTRLHPATNYKFRLCAINEFGASAFSDFVTWSTSGQVPTQPQPPSLQKKDVSCLNLAWIKRHSDEEFTLQMSEEQSGHGFLTVYNGPNSQHVCVGLKRNTQYRFRICANNDEGSSKWSDIVGYTTQPDRPKPPLRFGVKGKLHSHSFKVSWEPPKDNGGSEISRYMLEMEKCGVFEQVYNGSECEHSCDRLTPGTNYKLRVTCASQGGTSDFSEILNVTTLPITPGKCDPIKLNGKAKSTCVSLKWGYPKDEGGASVIEFEVELKLCGESVSKTVYHGKRPECIITGLMPGRQYEAIVRAFNKVGAGLWSDPITIESGAGAPDVPVDVTVSSVTSSTAVASWVSPPDNGAKITEYKLEWFCTPMAMGDQELKKSKSVIVNALSDGGGGSLTGDTQVQSVVSESEGVDNKVLLPSPGIEWSHILKDLQPASFYSLKIQAINSVGGGSFSSLVSFTTSPSSPGVPQNFHCQSFPTSLHLSWDEPISNGSPILYYNVYLSEKLIVTNGPETELSVEELLPETTYKAKVQAVNSVGVGAMTSIVKVTTNALPPAPPRLECIAISHSHMKLKWGDGKNQECTKYILQMENPRSKSFAVIYQGSSHYHKVSKLTETTCYKFRISACNEAGEGHFSSVYAFTTTRAPPQPLKAPKITNIDEVSCHVSWSSCKFMGTDKILYNVQICKTKSKEYVLAYSGCENNCILSSLEPQCEYNVRVCPLRSCTDTEELLAAAYSPPSTFTTLVRPQLEVPVKPSVQESQFVKKQLSDQQWAGIILFALMLIAILIAYLAQLILSRERAPL